MKRPTESDYTSQVAYTRALEEYCDMLEQPAQEPDIYPEEARDMGLEAVAYYTTPPAAQRKPLTDEAIQKVWDVVSGAVPGWSRHIAYARAIEAAHGIKENT